MTLDKDRKRLAAGEPRYKWLLPLLIGLAVAALVVVIIYSLAPGIFFG